MNPKRHIFKNKKFLNKLNIRTVIFTLRVIKNDSTLRECGGDITVCSKVEIFNHSLLQCKIHSTVRIQHFGWRGGRYKWLVSKCLTSAVGVEQLSLDCDRHQCHYKKDPDATEAGQNLRKENQ